MGYRIAFLFLFKNSSKHRHINVPEISIMPKTIYRVIVEKVFFREHTDISLRKLIRGWLKEKLFEYLLSFNQDRPGSNFYGTAIEGSEDAERFDNEELREAIEEPCFEGEDFGWNYYVFEEPLLCMTGTLELLASGTEAPTISCASLECIPGVKVSTEVIDDDNVENQAV
jgi:hypothetical protein